MDEYKKQKLIKIIGFLFLILFLSMVIIGQKTVSYTSLGIMVVGLAGILVLLYLYNRSQSR